MTSLTPLADHALQAALHDSLDIHFDGIVDPAARRTALQDACGRINDHLATAALLPRNAKLPSHPELIAAALRAARLQLCGKTEDA